MQEYPKALYLAGVMAMAADEDQEDDLRETGHADWHVDQKRMQSRGAAADAAPKQPQPDTAALDQTKAQLEELEMHLKAKDHELATKQQELAMRETQLAEAEADLAARLTAMATDADKLENGPPAPPDQPTDEKAPARSRKKQDAAQ